MTLASDIVEHGLNPWRLVAGDPSKRRIRPVHRPRGQSSDRSDTRLENPELVEGSIDAACASSLRKLSKEYQDAPIDSVSCVVFKGRKEAEHWIKLRHTGQNEGAALFRGPNGSAIKQRSGSKETPSQALDFLGRNKQLTADERSKVPSTSLKRLLAPLRSVRSLA